MGGFELVLRLADPVDHLRKMGEAAFQISHEQFANGALDGHGVPRELADRIWKRLVTSGTYSFNIALRDLMLHARVLDCLAQAHYPLEFYAASLAKASDDDSQFRLMRDALGHSIDVRPPSLAHSSGTWRPVERDRPCRRMAAIPRIGPTMAPRIAAAVTEHGPPLTGGQLQAIPGIGDKTIEQIRKSP